VSGVGEKEDLRVESGERETGVSEGKERTVVSFDKACPIKIRSVMSFATSF